MKPKSATQRRKEADGRKKKQGLTRVSVWVHETRKARLKEIEKQFQSPA